MSACTRTELLVCERDGGQAVGGCDGRQPDHHVADQAEGAGLQALGSYFATESVFGGDF